MPSCFIIRRSADSAYCSTAKAAVKRGREIKGYNEKEDIARFQAFCRFVLTIIAFSQLLMPQVYLMFSILCGIWQTFLL